MLEMLAEYRLEGLVIGLCTFLIIGLYHPLVIKRRVLFWRESEMVVSCCRNNIPDRLHRG